MRNFFRKIRKAFGNFAMINRIFIVVTVVSVIDAIIIGGVWGAIFDTPTSFTAGYVVYQSIIAMAICAAYGSVAWWMVCRFLGRTMPTIMVKQPREHVAATTFAVAIGILLVSTATMIGSRLLVAAI